MQLNGQGAEARYVDVSLTRVSFGSDRILQVICHDVTERERFAAHLRNEAEELELLVEARTRDLRESQTKLVQQEKMAALGKLVAGVAHEMNTPIGTINSNADILSRSLKKLRELITADSCPEAVREDRKVNQLLLMVEDIARINQIACSRIVDIVRSLRNFARLDEAEQKVADLHEGLDSTLTLVHHELKNRIGVVKQYGDIPAIHCHPNKINQVFMNLLVNAAQSISGEGVITIRTFREGDIVNVQFSDTGAGIRPDHLSRIFDPGFTTKGVGVGTGLGLSIVFQIIHDHGGSIDVESEVGKGSTFTLRLPIHGKEPVKNSK
jgi:signal transduction histidine kinase